MPTTPLESIYDTHADALFGYLLNLTRHEADTRDLLQSVFIKLANTPSLLDGVQNKRAYLLQIAHRQYIDMIRQRSASRRMLDRFAKFKPVQISEPESGPCSEERRNIEVALAELPEEQRSAVHLRIWEDLTFEEIASVTGVSKGTAVSRYRYGLEKLRPRLSDGSEFADAIDPAYRTEVAL